MVQTFHSFLYSLGESIMASPPSSPLEDAVKPFSKQSQTSKDKVMRLWEDAYLASGGDFRGVMSYYLEHTKSGKKHRYSIIENMRKSINEKMTKQERNLAVLLDGIKNLYAGYTKDEDRIRLLELLMPIFSKTELTQRGLIINRELWERARKNSTAPTQYVMEVEPTEHMHDPSAMRYELATHPMAEHHLYEAHLNDGMEDEEEVHSHGLKRAHEGVEMTDGYMLDHAQHPTVHDPSVQLHHELPHHMAPGSSFTSPPSDNSSSPTSKKRKLR